MLSEEDLALLEAINESGSLSRAAARLGKAPSTVSHAARQLEAKFDALLFDRRRYRLQLTPAGQLLTQEAARLMQDVSRLTRRVKQVAGGWEDRLWIVTDEVLDALDCGQIPQLVVYNKCDAANLTAFDPAMLLTSAKTGRGLPELLARLDEELAHRVRTIEVVLPYDKLALADILRSRGCVLAEEYRDTGVYYQGTVKIDDLHRFEPYLI